MTSITPHLAAQITKAIKAIPEDRRRAPEVKTIVTSPNEALIIIND
jgi:hypothetical protein